MVKMKELLKIFVSQQEFMSNMLILNKMMLMTYIKCFTIFRKTTKTATPLPSMEMIMTLEKSMRMMFFNVFASETKN